MRQLDDLAAELSALCFGADEPLAAILTTGQFPDGWVPRFERLLDEARLQVEATTSVPAKLMVAIHFCSVYPWVRYLAWSTLKREKNEQGRSEVGRIAHLSEIFLMKLASDELAADGGRLAADGPLRGGDDTELARRLVGDS